MAFSEEELAPFVSDVQKNAAWYFTNDQRFQQSFAQMIDYLLGKSKQCPSFANNYYGYQLAGLLDMLPKSIAAWQEKHDRLLQVLSQQTIWSYLDYRIWRNVRLICQKLPADEGLEYFEHFWDKLLATGAQVQHNLWSSFAYLHYYAMPDAEQPSEGGELQLVRSFVLRRLETEEKLVVDAFCNYEYATESFVKMLAQKKPALIDKYLKQLLANTRMNTHFGTASFLLRQDAPKYEKAVLAVVQKINTLHEKIEGLELLYHFFPQQYRDTLLKHYYDYLKDFQTQSNANPRYCEPYMHRYDAKGRYLNGYYLSVHAVEQLLTMEKDKATGFLNDFFKEVSKVQADMPVLLHTLLGEEALPWLFLFLEKETKSNEPQLYRNTFERIQQLPYQPYEEVLWQKTARSKSKSIRELTAITLSKQGEAAIAKAAELLRKGNNNDVRQTGALILSLLGSDKAKEILWEELNLQKNDDTRDLMLQSIAELLFQSSSEKEVKKMIAQAAQRGKLEKPVEKWIDESKLPALYYLSGKALALEDVRFLLYRMSRIKEIKPDLEARPLLRLIDRTRSGAFAKALFELYLQNGADAKQKYCLALAGLLGDDEVVDILKSTVLRWGENTLKYQVDAQGNYHQTGEGARLKMAEYAVGALALIGSNKALRVVEFLSRKFRSKNKNIGAAALQALETAAQELGMTMYELSDSIVPDFGFEGLYKTFEVGNKEYRAFVDSNFKMVFFDEDYKKLKSLPKGASKELQGEFKEIAKEIREVVRAQSGRLEQYMVLQRRWQKEAWEGFFLNNPVMFVYAMQIIWGEYDAQGQLQQSFYCAEDSSLLNVEDEEVVLNEEGFVGMIHPMQLSEEQKKQWKSKLFQLGISTAFEQLQRPVHQLDEKDRERFFLNSFDRKIEARQAVGYFEKLGWQRGSVVDSGMVSAYRKVFDTAGIEALIETEGIIMGYYDFDDSRLGRLYFVKKGTVRFGSYTYDEPKDDKDPRLVPLGEVPAIIYSEIIGDLEKIAPKSEEEKKV
jgi:hypothetical protein